MFPGVLMYLVSPESDMKPVEIVGFKKRLSSLRFRRSLSKSPPAKASDPYLLILLADQELVEGREQQAKSLVEAAYEAFDQRTEARVYRLHLAG